jgi:hypothetical protein
MADDLQSSGSRHAANGMAMYKTPPHEKRRE